MQAIKEIFGATADDISKRKHNVVIPICLGNKFFVEKNFPSENIKRYLEWALAHTKEKVLVFVVDKIQHTNYFVRGNRVSEAKSMARVLEDGAEVKRHLVDLVDNFFAGEKSRIEVISYEEYEEANPSSRQITDVLYEEFKSNDDFKGAVLQSVKESVNDREFTAEQYLRLCNYVLDEFAFCYCGMKFKGVLYDLYIYPNVDAVLLLIEDIKRGALFGELSRRLPAQKIAVAILG